MMKNRIYLVFTALVLSGLVSANDGGAKVPSDKKNPIINLFEAPLKAFQTKPGEAIAVFQPEIVRQSEGGENQTSSWFQAGQSLGSQVSSLTGWLTNRLYANQQSSTTPKPDPNEPDFLVEVQQIKPNQDDNVGENNKQPISVLRLGQNNKMAKRNRLRPLQQNGPPITDDEFLNALEDIAEQQRIENDRFDDEEDEYDDGLEEIEELHEEIPILVHRGSMVPNRVRNENPSRLRQNTRIEATIHRRRNSNQIRNQNMNKRRQQQNRPQQQTSKRRIIIRNESIPNMNRRPNGRPNMSANTKRGFNDNTRYSDNEYEDDEDNDDEDYDNEDNSDDNDDNNNNNSNSDLDSDDYNEEDDSDSSLYNNSKDKNKDENDYDEDDAFEDLANYEPIEIRPQSSGRPIQGFRPIEDVPIGGNGHIDRIIQMNQHFPTNAIIRRQQILQQEENKRKRDREREQKLQQALLNNQHIIIPIHFIPDSIPYSEIVPQVTPQAQIQVVAQHHHTVQNTGPLSTNLDNKTRPNRKQNQNQNRNKNKNQNAPNRRQGNNRIVPMNQQNRRKQNQKRPSTAKPNNNDDVFYSVNLIAQGPATAGRPNSATTRPTRRPATKKNTPRSSTTPKRQMESDAFRGEKPISVVTYNQDQNRPDASPQSSNSEELHETPPQYVAPAPSISDTDDDDDDDDDDDAKPQARTQFYLPQHFYQILGSDKYLSVGNNGRFLLKSARSLDLNNVPKSDVEHPAKVVETTDEKLSQDVSEKSVPVPVEVIKEPDVKLISEDKVIEKIEENPVISEVPLEKVETKVIDEVKVEPKPIETLKLVEKTEESKPIEKVQLTVEKNAESTVTSEKEIDDGSISTTTERPLTTKEHIEVHESSTVAPPLNKVAKVLLRSEIVQEKQNGGRFLVKSEQIRN